MNRERTDFVFTKEMLYVIGGSKGKDSEDYKFFKNFSANLSDFRRIGCGGQSYFGV